MPILALPVVAAQAAPRVGVSPTVVLVVIAIMILVVLGRALLVVLASLGQIMRLAVNGIVAGVSALIVVGIGIVVLAMIVFGGDDRPRESVVAPGSPPTSSAVRIEPPSEAIPERGVG